MTEAQERYFQRGTILVGMHKEKTHSKGLIERFEFEWREVADDPARMSHLAPGRGKGSARNRERSRVKSKAEDRARSPISSIPFSRQTSEIRFGSDLEFHCPQRARTSCPADCVLHFFSQRLLSVSSKRQSEKREKPRARLFSSNQNEF